MYFTSLIWMMLYMIWLQPFIGVRYGATAQRSQPDEVLCTGLPLHVVMIGIDGLTTDGLLQANTPLLDQLRQNGAWSLNTQPVQPTLSSPNWASMLSGVLPQVHGIYENGWEAPPASVNPSNPHYQLPVPSFFEVMRQQHPHANTACFYQWQDLGRLIEPKAPTVMAHTGSETITINRATRYLKKYKPAFTFIHFDHVDHAGHFFGYQSQSYLNAIESADELVGRIVKAVKKSGMADYTVFVITTDHGGIGHNHGNDTPEECNTPFIVCGPGIKKGYAIKSSMNIYDIAPTLAKILCLKMPAHWAGKPVEELFDVSTSAITTP